MTSFLSGTIPMMNDGTAARQRDIVLMPFPYSDLSQTKRRPALILSTNSYNLHSEDVICCAVTSNPRQYHGSILIEPTDLESGRLAYELLIKPNKVFTLHQKNIIKALGRTSMTKGSEVVQLLQHCIQMKE